MANDVVMPRLGWTMEVGRVVEWIKQDGDPVAAGEIIFSVESDKAVTDVEALDSGILRIPPDSPEPGVEVPVGARLAYIVSPGAPLPFEQTSGAGELAPAPSMPTAAAASVPGVRRDRHGKPAASPRARRTASALGIDWTVLAGSGSSGRIVERDVRAAVPTATPAPTSRATPVVRRLAAEHGVELDRLATARPSGRVTRAEVRAAATATSEVMGEALTPIRRVIAERMAESARTVAPVTLTTEADATELARIRDQLKAEVSHRVEPVPSFSDLLVRLAALALAEHPDLNASLIDGQIVRHAAIHIGIAVETSRGLLVPVIRDARQKTVREISVEATRLIEQTRAGTVAPDDLRGGTFTITNLGMYEIDAFTPIINLPECAILGVGRIVARPVVIDEAAETIAVRKMMALSLTFDHRVVDGAPAARFLQHIKQLVERPYSGLLR